jgi:hypothetical protein
MTILSALLFCFLSAIVIIFQLALILGAPWGEFTMGGRYPGRLPYRIRAAPALSSILIFGFAVIVLRHAGIAFSGFDNLSENLIWVVVAYCLVGVVLNAITRSKRERKLWLPVVAAMLICSLIVGFRI